MSQRGGRDTKTLADVGCSPETINKIVLFGYDKETSLSRNILLRTFDKLYAILPPDETDPAKAEKNKVRSRKAAETEALSDLAIRVCGLANVLSGMYVAANAQREATKNYLNDVLPSPARNDFQAAIDAKFQIRFRDVIIASLERQLKERSK